MKKNAIAKLIKDVLLVVVVGLIAYLVLSYEFGKCAEVFAAAWAIGCLPYGWRTVSKIVTAMSIQGIMIKLLVSVCLGWLIVPVVLVVDVIRCLVGKIADAA